MNTKSSTFTGFAGLISSRAELGTGSDLGRDSGGPGRLGWAGWLGLSGLMMWMVMPVKGAESTPALALQEVASGLTSPTVLRALDDGSGRLLIADQIGKVHVLSAEGKLEEKLFLDVRDRLTELLTGFDERGLLGLTLHPGFKENRRLFVYYSAPLREGGPKGWDHTGRLSEFKVRESDWAEVDLASERVVLEIDEPAFNHDGGCLAFGPDGYLYVSVGDGGKANDVGEGHSPQGNGQDTSNLLGTILRLDVDKGDPYGIPSDNPFVKGKGRPEIFAYGLRNPWRMSFDRGGKHELFVGDIGQTLYEEVNIIVKGGNYGWRIREGFHCFDPENPNRPPTDCPKTGADGSPLLDPIFEYKNINGFRRDPEAKGISVTGGFVYRGKALPELVGRYIFADWSRTWALPDGVLFAASRPASGSDPWSIEVLGLASRSNGRLGAYVTAFGEDADGELYVLTNGRNSLSGETGKAFKLVRHAE